VVAALALLTFFWGLVKFITKVGGDAKAAAEGKTFMVWSVIALFVMVSIWGMIYFIGAQLFPSYGWDQYEAPPIPTFYTP